MPLLLLLLTILSLLSSPSLPILPQTPPSQPMAEAGTFVYIRQPTAAAEPVAAGEAWRIEVSVYATTDEATPITVTVQLDPRLELLRRAAFGQAGGPVSCVGAFNVTCSLPVKRWAEGYVLLEVTTRDDAWPCAPMLITATSEAPGLTPGAVTRERALIGADRCVALPYLES